MNRLTLCLLFSMTLLTASSQKVYFVYLQTETDQPFFVKMNGKVYSSTASGYLILSRLRDSSYDFNVGFPQNKWPEQSFSVAVNKKDHGYLLKDFGEKGWGLFDLQNLSVQMSSSGNTKADATVTTEKKEVSAFTDILSKATDDPSLKAKPVQIKTEEKKPELIAQEAIKKEDIKSIEIEKPVVKQEEPKVEIKEPPVIQKEEIKTVPVESYKPTIVTKKSESSTTEGFGLVFIDEYENGTKDTIQVIIPNPKPAVNVVKQEPKEEKKFLDIVPDTTQQVKEITQEIKKEITPPAETKLIVNTIPVNKPAVKNNCSEVASENDFFKLRKKMAAETADDDMISEARKYFKTKCFTVLQLKNLSTLFLNDAGKYKFFDAAYTYVSDAENFISLQSEIKDEYYINRFKAMLRN